MTQNVSFEFSNFGIFFSIFVLLKLTCLVTLFDRKLQVFKKLATFGIFNELIFNETFSVISKHRMLHNHLEIRRHFKTPKT